MKLKRYVRYLIALFLFGIVLIVISQLPSVEPIVLTEGSQIPVEKSTYRGIYPDVKRVESIKEVKDFYYKFTP